MLHCQGLRRSLLTLPAIGGLNMSGQKRLTCTRMLFLALGLCFCFPWLWFCFSCSCWYHVLAFSEPINPLPYSSLHPRSGHIQWTLVMIYICTNKMAVPAAAVIM